MIQSPNPKVLGSSVKLDYEKLTTEILLNQVVALVEKYFSVSKKLDVKQQSISLQPYIAEYKSYKAIHEPYTLEYLKLDRSVDLGTIILNFELKISKHQSYSFYLCWVEDIFEKGKVFKQKYVYRSIDLNNEISIAMFDVDSFLDSAYTKAKLKAKTALKAETKMDAWDYSTHQFSDFSKVFEQILEKHSISK